VKRIGLLGGMSWESSAEYYVYVGRLRDRHGLEVLVPGPDDRRLVHTRSSTRNCVPVFDTTRLHAEKAVEMALESLPVR
jgi:aspartate/glutamate racemase